MEHDEILEQLEADTLRMMVKDLQNALSGARCNTVRVEYGSGSTEYGPGVSISLTADQVATAIMAYLVTQDVHVVGPRTVRVNADMEGSIYVDPSGSVVASGIGFSGRGV